MFGRAHSRRNRPQRRARRTGRHRRHRACDPCRGCSALGLSIDGTRTGRLADGSLIQLGRVTGLWLEILGRDMTCDALVLPEGTTALIGQIPLEALDLIVDPARREVRVNPSSPDFPIVDLLAV